MSYLPEWNQEVIGYATKYLARNAWRVHCLELDDMLQEAYILFMLIQNRYDYQSPSHFMAMWKRVLHNEVWWWATCHSPLTRGRSFAELPDKVAARIVDHRTSLDEQFEELKKQAPYSVRKLFEAADTKRRPRRKLRNGKRVSTADYLCKYAGVESKAPIGLRQLFESWLRRANIKMYEVVVDYK